MPETPKRYVAQWLRPKREPNKLKMGKTKSLKSGVTVTTVARVPTSQEILWQANRFGYRTREPIEACFLLQLPRELAYEIELRLLKRANATRSRGEKIPLALLKYRANREVGVFYDRP